MTEQPRRPPSPDCRFRDKTGRAGPVPSAAGVARVAGTRADATACRIGRLHRRASACTSRVWAKRRSLVPAFCAALVSLVARVSRVWRRRFAARQNAERPRLVPSPPCPLAAACHSRVELVRGWCAGPAWIVRPRRCAVIYGCVSRSLVSGAAGRGRLRRRLATMAPAAARTSTSAAPAPAAAMPQEKPSSLTAAADWLGLG